MRIAVTEIDILAQWYECNKKPFINFLMKRFSTLGPDDAEIIYQQSVLVLHDNLCKEQPLSLEYPLCVYLIKIVLVKGYQYLEQSVTTNQDIDQKIVAYLWGTITADEKNSLEQMATRDDNIRMQMGIYKDLLISIQKTKNIDDQEVFAQLKSCDKRTLLGSFTQKEYPIIRRIVIWGLTAAAILALTFVLKDSLDSKLYNQIYENYYKQMPEVLLDRDGYYDHDYNQALRLWIEGNTNEAIKVLNKIRTAGERHPHYEGACWYLALFYIKMHKKSKAIEVLQQIVKDRGYYGEKASEVLKQLQTEKIP